MRGESQGDQFVVNATAGSFAGPATILPTDPFVLKGVGEGSMIFTDTGEIISVQVSGGDHGTVSVNGNSVSARHFIVEGVTRREVWLDNRGIPVMFRIVEDGTPIDFVRQNTTASPDDTTVAAFERPVLARLENGNKVATASWRASQALQPGPAIWSQTRLAVAKRLIGRIYNCIPSYSQLYIIAKTI